MYVINDAHQSVTAINVTSDNTRIVSGGLDGEVKYMIFNAKRLECLKSVDKVKLC